ncbi:MAG: ABC transporter permease [Candidatus Geothermincolia bacterium]
MKSEEEALQREAEALEEGPKISIIERKIPFFLISRHLLRGNKWTLTLVIFLMSVAFVNLVFINSLFNGIVEMADRQVVATTSGNITMQPVRGSQYIDNAPGLIDKVRATEGVAGASSRTAVPASLLYRGIEGNYQIFAVQPSLEKTTTNISEKMMSGSYLSDSDTDSIVIGRQIAGGKGVEMNSTSFKGAKPGQSVTVLLGGQARQFTIKGVFYTKYFEADRQAFITQKAFDQMMPPASGKATTIIVKTDKKGGEETVITRLKKAVPAAQYLTWKEASGVMKSVTNSFVTIDALLTTVGFIIAAVVIFIIVYVDISDKRRQIGIFRAIGIKSYLVGSAYVLQSTIFSLVGVLLGSAIFFFAIIPYFHAYPFQIPLGDVTLYVNIGGYIWRAVAVIVVSIISGMIPAILATRKPILDEIAGR